MKLPLFTSFFAIAVAVADEQSTLRGSSAPAAKELVYLPPQPTADCDVKCTWDQMANEAALMQKMIAEGRTKAQCIESCNNTPKEEINRARCRKQCDQISENGNDSTSRTFNCNDCNTFPSGGNRRERCKAACRDSQVNQVEDCIDAETCSECRKYCGSGVVLDECYDDVGCSSAEDRRSDRDCSDARECGECNSFCDNSSDREDCRDDFNCNGNSGDGGKKCDDAEKCGDCKKFCSGSEKKDCKKDLCDSEELIKLNLM
jgi:hypothetical protein